MLSVKSYPQDYVAQCRARFSSIVARFSDADTRHPGNEPLVFNTLVLALDNCFCHRMRGQEGKYGNPLNEVRMLANSIMNNGDRLMADSTIKYDPAKAVLGYGIGEPIAIDADAFGRLASAFLDEINRRFG